MKHFNAIDWVMMVLLIIGGINWGLVGLFGVDLVATLFGSTNILTRLIYIAVGIAALYTLFTLSMKPRE